MDKAIQKILNNIVTKCRKILEEGVSEILEGRFGIDKKGQIEDENRLVHLSVEDLENRRRVVSHYLHIRSSGLKDSNTVLQLIRENAFTHLNRLVIIKILEEQKLMKEIRGAISKNIKSNRFRLFLAEHPDNKRQFKQGKQEQAYCNFLLWLGSGLSEEIPALFSIDDPANFLIPDFTKLLQVIELLNSEELKNIWTEDETIGWVYQYFTPKELRSKAREESSAPRNSYELAFTNQFYTPRYIVEFLTDNTLGRIWYEMNQGATCLREKCRYLVRRPDEVFLSSPKNFKNLNQMIDLIRHGNEKTFPVFDNSYSINDFAHCVNGYLRHYFDGWKEIFRTVLENSQNYNGIKTQDMLDYLFFLARADRHMGGGLLERLDLPYKIANEVRARIIKSHLDDLSQEEMLNLPVFVENRPLKDPRDIKILDPACVSGHFLLYCFDLLQTIYIEAYDNKWPAVGISDNIRLPSFSETKKTITEDYPDRSEFLKAIPGLILRYNLHGIDIDPRAVQIASMALWLRAQKAYNEMGIPAGNRPPIIKSNIVCAEPLPGEQEMLNEFAYGLQPKVMGELVKFVLERTKMAGEAGSTLKIGEELKVEISEAENEWEKSFQKMVEKKKNVEYSSLFTEVKLDELQSHENKQLTHDFSDITDEEFLVREERQTLKSLRAYAKDAADETSFLGKLHNDDIERGSAFIEVLRKRYDVVLMNPLFGSSTY